MCSNFFKMFQLPELPSLILSKLGCHQVGYPGGYLAAGPDIQKKGPGAPGKQIFDASRPFETYRPDYLADLIWEAGVQLFSPIGVLVSQLFQQLAV